MAKKLDKSAATIRELAQVANAGKAVGKPRDAQQNKVYSFGNNVLGYSHREDWTIVQCQEFVNYVWHCYFGPSSVPPAVDDGRGQACASCNPEHMRLPPWARNRGLILHEIAHAILGVYDGQSYWYKWECHGPEFMRLVAHLEGEFGSWATVDVLKKAKLYGLRVAPPSRIPHPYRRRKPTGKNPRESWLRRC